MLLGAAAPAQEGANGAPPAVYEDAYFDESEIAVIDQATAGDDLEKGSPMRYSAIYRHYVDVQEDRRALVEDGLEFDWGMDTLQWGELSVELQQLTTNGERNRDTSSQKIVLEQREFALNENVVLDNTLGHFRNATPNLISSGFRFFLPTTVIQGVSSQARTARSALSFEHGEIGNYEGIATNGFSRMRGDLTGLSVDHELGERVRLAGQWRRTHGARDGDLSQNVVALAGQYESEDRSQRHQLRSLSDSKGNDGIWYDGLSRVNQWEHRYGAFYFEPELRWTDQPIQNDQQGVYWRSNFNSFRWRWTLFTELSQTDVDDNPLVNGRTSTRSFANANWLMRRDLQIGGVLSINTQHPESGSNVPDLYGYSAQMYATKTWPLVRSRFETRVVDQNVDIGDSREYQVRIDNNWTIRYFDRLANEIDLRWNEDSSYEYTFSVLTGKFWSEKLNTTLQAQVILNNDNSGFESEDFNLGLAVSWLPLKDFFVDLSATMNESHANPPVGPSNVRRDGTVLLTVGYSRSRGAPTPLVGFDRGSSGTGRIEGYVFLDDNGNGKRDLDEETLPGITVYLDGRFSTITDAEGRYEFIPVPAGRHELRLAVWDAPLPWGLDDEEPVEISVPVRSRIDFDFGLIRLNE